MKIYIKYQFFTDHVLSQILTHLWYSLESVLCTAREDQDCEICPTLFHSPG